MKTAFMFYGTAINQTGVLVYLKVTMFAVGNTNKPIGDSP